jgi:hypothetical protein
VPSASRRAARLAVLGASAALLAGVASGCSTTQEKAERQQARATHILDARAERQKKKHADGSKHRGSRGSSAGRPDKGER